MTIICRCRTKVGPVAEKEAALVDKRKSDTGGRSGDKTGAGKRYEKRKADVVRSHSIFEQGPSEKSIKASEYKALRTIFDITTRAFSIKHDMVTRAYISCTSLFLLRLRICKLWRYREKIFQKDSNKEGKNR